MLSDMEFGTNIAQREDIKRRFLNGQNMREIAEARGISKGRVHQLLSAMGVDTSTTGDLVQRRCWGISAQVRKEIGAKYGQHPFVAYASHRKRAEYRGVAFAMTFSQWWKVWQDSGKWTRRGRSNDEYCMARRGDKGAYEIGNVSIKTNGENREEFLAGR